MKKTFLPVLVGLAVVGGAYAVPSMDVQQTNCEDGQHVWVEKTKTCIPKNPCLSDDTEIYGAYCIEPDFRVPDFSNFLTASDGGFLSLIIKKYFQTVMKTTVDFVWVLTPLDEHYVSVKTGDKGYYVIDFNTIDGRYEYMGRYGSMEQLYKAACWAYGKRATDAGIPETNFEMKCDDTTESECEGIVDFANSLLQSVGESGVIVLRYRDELIKYGRCYMARYAS